MGNGINDTAKILVGMGLVLVVAGIIVLFLGKFPGFKSLPGDLVIKKENFTLYFPIGTSILISILLTLILLLWRKFGS